MGTAQFTSQLYHLWSRFGVALAAAALAGGNLAIANLNDGIDGGYNLFDVRFYRSNVSSRNGPRSAGGRRFKVSLMYDLISSLSH
jgi:hypothetical protein